MHIKYRPKDWSGIIGNKTIVKVLSQKKDSRPVLLIGERGAGKTTIAHILARQFGAPLENVMVRNCVNESGIAEARELLTALKRSSLFGDKKVLILDEAHHLSSKALNNFLVPLDGEDSDRLPDNILVIACTTEPDKIPSVLLDRFLTFRVKNLTYEESLSLINFVSEKEEIKLTKWLKVLLIEKMEGNPRRLLTGLAKVRYCESEDEANELLELVKLDEDSDILDLFKIYRSGSMPGVKEALNKLLKDKTPSSVRVGLMNIISGYLISKWSKPDDTAVCDLYKRLKEAEGYPEKANLIYAVMRK